MQLLTCGAWAGEEICGREQLVSRNEGGVSTRVVGLVKFEGGDGGGGAGVWGRA